MQNTTRLDVVHARRDGRSDKERLLSLLLEAEDKRQQASRTVPARENRSSPVPLSYAQERLWFLDQLGLVGAAYNLSIAHRLEGHLNVGALERSVSEIVRRHEILRTRIEVQEGVPYQIIDPARPFELQGTDLSHVVDIQQREQLLHECIQREQLHRFDLSSEPILRMLLVRLGEREHALLLTVHHIASDGWSCGVLMHELGALYSAYLREQPNPLSELPVQYADYAIWQRHSLQGEVLREQLQYWREQLLRAPPQLELPTDRPRPSLETFKGAELRLQLPMTLAHALKQLGQSEGATLFMVALAAYQVLLSRWSGQQDVIVGSPIAGRTNRQVEGLVGFFVNTLVLRTDVQGDLTFRQLLRRVKEVTLGAYAHQDLPFEVLVKELRPERNLTHQPLFQVTLALQNFPEERLELPGLTCSNIDAECVTTLFDLMLYLYEGPDGLSGLFQYATDLFDAATVARMAGHFRVLLEGIVANPDRPIKGLPLLSEPEKQQLVVDWNGTVASYPHGKLIHELFEEQVEHTPEAVAVICGQQRLTYTELNGRANQLARHLRAKGVGPDELVGLCVERGVEMVVAVLGILKAGGVYVPMDPDSPTERLHYILRDASPTVVLTQERLKERLPGTQTELISLDTDWKEIAQQPLINLASETLRLRSDQMAYVIYTSGSTGQPKGVMVEHRNVTRLLIATEKWFEFNERDVWTLFHSVAFDFSVWELWGALLYGGRVVVVPYLTARAPQEFYRLLCDEGVTVLNQTPSAFAQLIAVQALTARKHSLRLVIFGGEALDVRMLRPWVQRNGAESPKLVNMYGITETTVHVTYQPLTREEIESEHSSLIGKPIQDLRLYLLDSHRQLVPIGVTGEIYVGGAGVARGYLNRPELTAERFLPDPIANDPRERVYKTGDLGRWRANGTLVYQGRNDHQVKVRGYRIELGEIEAHLVQHPQVKEAVVTVREDVPGEKRLVAYITRHDQRSPSVEDLRAHLKAVLPEYMVPSAIVILENLPLTLNGKLDRRALPEPDLRAYVIQQYEAPEGEVEEALAEIWRELLQLERVGRRNNFFELGGHSLHGLKLIAKVAERFMVHLSAIAVFQSPTIHEMAQLVESLRSAHEKSLNPGAMDFEEGVI